MQPPPPGPPPAAAVQAAVKEWEQQNIKDTRRIRELMKEHLSILDALPPYVSRGDRFATLMEMLGCPLQRDELEDDPAPGMRTSHWPLFPITTEIACLGEQWDKSGFLWGRGGHFPLLVSVGTYRSYSHAAAERKSIAQQKKKQWRDSLQRWWPWWIEHESERSFWLPGAESSGRGWSGSPRQMMHGEQLSTSFDLQKHYPSAFVF